MLDNDNTNFKLELYHNYGRNCAYQNEKKKKVDNVKRDLKKKGKKERWAKGM